MYESLIYRFKTRLRMSQDSQNDEFNSEIEDLIASALKDLEKAGIKKLDPNDPLIRQAVATYVKANFGQPDNYAELKAAYDEQKGSLQTYSEYKEQEADG